jgi:nucleoid-associated protein YgaU
MMWKTIALLAALTLALSIGIAYAEDECPTEEEARSMIEGYRAREAEANAKIDMEQPMVDRLKDRVASLEATLGDMKSEIRRMREEIGKYETSHTVVEGEYLSMIAGQRYVYNHKARWPRIYRANRDKIKDPNLIYPKWVLTIPRGLPSTHTVVEGEWLARISGYFEIYNDASKWKMIYDANRDHISDPDLIHPDQVLDIPR